MGKKEERLGRREALIFSLLEFPPSFLTARPSHVICALALVLFYLLFFCFINFIGLSLSKYQKVRYKRYLESHTGHLPTKSVKILRNAY